MLQFQGGHGGRDRNVDGGSDGEIIKRDTKGDDTNKSKNSDSNNPQSIKITRSIINYQYYTKLFLSTT